MEHHDPAAAEHARQVGYIAELIGAAEGQLTLLREVAEALRGSASTLAVSEKAQLPQLTTDFPFAGSHRWLIPRQAVGGALALKAGAAALVLADNPNRLGGTIVNAGENPVTLFFSDVGNAGKGALGQIILVAGGGSWDLRIGNLLWSGSITALSAKGTEISVVEV